MGYGMSTKKFKDDMSTTFFDEETIWLDRGQLAWGKAFEEVFGRDKHFYRKCNDRGRVRIEQHYERLSKHDGPSSRIAHRVLAARVKNVIDAESRSSRLDEIFTRYDTATGRSMSNPQTQSINRIKMPVLKFNSDIP